MAQEHILMKMAAEKERKIRSFIKDFLGHDPTSGERKEFTMVHTLGESKIYYKGKLVQTLKYNTRDPYSHI